jgi:glycosyltransferase involved in cell wall biosynthesis
MQSKRPFLYLIVTHYPYGFAEPFLQDELKIIAKHFEKIYFILPERNANSEKSLLSFVPDNAQIIEFNIAPTGPQKLSTIFNWFSKAWTLERAFIKSNYGQKNDLFHLKTLLGFQAKASAFASEMEQLFKVHNHPKDKIVLYSYWFSYFASGMAILRDRHPQLRAVTRVHGWDCFFYVSPGNYLPLRPWTISKLDSTNPISESGVNHLKMKLKGIPTEKIKCYRLGIEDLNEPFETKKIKGRLRILSIAFIRPVKRIDRIIQAIEKIYDTEIEWIHIGGSFSNDNSIEKKAEELIRNKSNVHVQFLGDKSKEFIYDFLKNRNADILLCTSESEGIPVSMMEAMGHGMPVLSVNVGGVSEIVEDEFNGSLIPANADAESIAAYLVRWANMDQVEYTKFSQNAYTTYQNKYRAKENHLRFFNEVLNVE